MITVDSSALIAILFGEPEAGRLIDHLARSQERCLSAVSYVETGTVLAGRMRGDPAQAIPLLDEILAELGVRIHPVDEAQMRIAMRARVVFGRGFGGNRGSAAAGVEATPSAGLNFGDCFAYALAKALAAPLLFVGDDFAATDVEPALARPHARLRRSGREREAGAECRAPSPHARDGRAGLPELCEGGPSPGHLILSVTDHRVSALRAGPVMTTMKGERWSDQTIGAAGASQSSCDSSQSRTRMAAGDSGVRLGQTR